MKVTLFLLILLSTFPATAQNITVIEGSNDLGQTLTWVVSNLDPQSFSADAGADTTRTSQPRSNSQTLLPREVGDSVAALTQDA
jgi:hypothetical protein